MRQLMILISALGLLAGACGDDGGTLGGFGSDDFCDSNERIEARLDGMDAEFETAFASGDFSGLGAYFGEALELMRGAAGSAPGEIRADIDTLVTGFEAFVAVLDDYDYNFFQIPEDEPRLAALDNPEYEAASDRVDAYCGVDTDADVDSDGGSGADLDESPEPDPDPVDPADAPDPGDEVEFGDDQIADLVAEALAQNFNIDVDLARCIVEEAGLSTPGAIDPSAFEDLSAPICGTTWGAILSGG
jgi:hypothetical protein